MFRGVHELNLDAKGRLAIPSRYHPRLLETCNGQLIVTVDSDRCLLLYPLPEWELIERKLMSLPSIDKQVRRLQRLLLGHATECDMDSQSRVLLPLPLREFADLKKHSVLIGQGNKFEIWDRDNWTKMCDQLVKEESKLNDVHAVLEKLSI